LWNARRFPSWRRRKFSAAAGGVNVENAGLFEAREDPSPPVDCFDSQPIGRDVDGVVRSCCDFRKRKRSVALHGNR
jgi:hypothetical protein